MSDIEAQNAVKRISDGEAQYIRERMSDCGA